MPPMHQNIFSTSSNIPHGTGRNEPPSIVSSHVRMSHPPANGTPLPHHRPERLNNQQPSDLTKRQNLGREGVVMGERSLLTNRITNFNNNSSAGVINNNQRHHNVVNSTLNNLNSHFSNSSSSSSAASSSSAGANNLLGSNSTDYRQHLNL